MKTWSNCIVTFIDLIGISSLLERNSREGIALLRRMHNKVFDEKATLSAHEEVCFWNDSVLLLGYVDNSSSTYLKIMNEVSELKRKIDTIKKSFAICMKGQVFPPPYKLVDKSQTTPNMFYLKASSLAFANCFIIEKALKRYRKHWYIDGRIVKKIKPRKEDLRKSVTLHPRNRKGSIYMYRGSFWDAGNKKPR